MHNRSIITNFSYLFISLAHTCTLSASLDTYLKQTPAQSEPYSTLSRFLSLRLSPPFLAKA